MSRPEDAKEFFRTALKDAPANSLLQKLAQAAVDDSK
jgi:hypothetical protein